MRDRELRACRVCGSASVTPLTLEETMYGTREQFEYLECAACGSLSIADVPADLARHYPDTYYSFGATPRRSRHGRLTRRLAVVALLNVPGLGKRLPAQFSRWRGLAGAGAKPSTRILDVGCGDGALLRTLKQNGFTDLHGVDPFIAHGTAEAGLTITKGGLADLAGPYDFILLSHTLEHMPDPHDALREVARLCAADGHAMIGVPVVNRSWKELGIDWIGLDPPRHLFVPTVAALTALINSVPGLRVKDIWFDATAMEFFDSELARRRVPIFDRATGQVTDAARHFDKAQLQRWSRQAADYNKRGAAGTASFLVERQ